LQRAVAEVARKVYVKGPFNRDGKAGPVLYALSAAMLKDAKLFPEGVVKHRQLLRFIRAKLFDRNYVTKSPVGLKYIDAVFVDEEDYGLVRETLKLPGLPLHGVKGLKSGTVVGDFGETARTIVEYERIRRLPKDLLLYSLWATEMDLETPA
jgi:hypothetical protein